VQGTPGNAGTNGVKDREGTIAGDSGKEKDVGTIVRTAIPGAGIGAIADQGSGKGAAIGAASGVSRSRKQFVFCVVAIER